MCLSYAPPAAQPVDGPITTIGWRDDPDVRPEDLREWEDYGSARHHLLDGEPLGFLTAPAPLLRVIEDDFVAVPR